MFNCLALLPIERRIVGRNGVVRRALKHEQLFCLFRDNGDCLNCRRTRADYANSLAGKIDSLWRPVPSVVNSTGERIETFESGLVRRRQAAGRHYAERGAHPFTCFRGQRPACSALVKRSRSHARIKADIAPQIVTIGHMIGIAQYFRLRRILFRPVPFLL